MMHFTDNCVLVSAGCVSAAGMTPGAVGAALLQDAECFSLPTHFDSKGRRLGVVHALDGDCPGGVSRARKLLELLRENWTWPAAFAARRLPLFCATTVGAVDLLERAADGEAVPDTSLQLADDAEDIFHAAPRRLLVAEACASGARALEAAAFAVRSGATDAALVLGADIVSEFVTSGFTALGACSASVARPYAADRDGLTLGEAAAGVILARESLARRLDLPVLGRICGWGASCDGAHITAPDLSGRYLAEACRAALENACWQPSDVDMIAGHGTGTVYNDLAEAVALNTVFDGARPLFTVKGKIGHTLGATGVLQVLAGLEMAKVQRTPGAGYAEPVMTEAAARLERQPREVAVHRFVSVNVGFGGLNNVLAVEKGNA